MTLSSGGHSPGEVCHPGVGEVGRFSRSRESKSNSGMFGLVEVEVGRFSRSRESKSNSGMLGLVEVLCGDNAAFWD